MGILAWLVMKHDKYFAIPLVFIRTMGLINRVLVFILTTNGQITLSNLVINKLIQISVSEHLI